MEAGSLLYGSTILFVNQYIPMSVLNLFLFSFNLYVPLFYILSTLGRLPIFTHQILSEFYKLQSCHPLKGCRSSVNRVSAFNFFSYHLFFNSGTNFVALLCTHSNFAMSFRKCCEQICATYSRCRCTKVVHRLCIMFTF